MTGAGTKRAQVLLLLPLLELLLALLPRGAAAAAIATATNQTTPNLKPSSLNTNQKFLSNGHRHSLSSRQRKQITETYNSQHDRQSHSPSLEAPT
jgi:hypothetical protein